MRLALPATLSLLLLSACSRQSDGLRIQRVAILRFENLGSDPAKDWIGRAFSEVITGELTTAPGIYAISISRMQSTGKALGPRPAGTPGISSQRAAALASGANRLGYGQFTADGGRLDARLMIEDPATGKIVQVFSAAGSGMDVIAAADWLARQLSGSAAKYGASDPAALEAFASALEFEDAATASVYLERAIAADPNFLPPYRFLAELKARNGDRAGAASVLETALARGGSSTSVERAFLEGQLANLRGDRAGVERSLQALTRLNPQDPTIWRSLAETAMAHHNYQRAVQAFSKALEIEPEDPTAWNQYGYSAAYTGDLTTAMSALRRYQTMRPAEANPLDSLGDVNVLHGRFREAEAFYLEAAKKDPNFLDGADLFKAAMVRLMTGDLAGADKLAKQYSAARAALNDPLAPYRNAEWGWATGRRRQACQQMEGVARSNQSGPLRELASRAYGTLAVWTLLLGDREAAARIADQAISLASANSAIPAYVARFLSQPPAQPAEWAARAERLFSNPAAQSIKDYALVYALLLSREFEPASAVIKRLESGGSASTEANLDILQAWTLIETGHVQEAAPRLRWNPVPPSGGVGAFFSFSFPRIYYLRGVVAEKEGKTEEARNNYRLFLQLSGPDPLIWGEEKKASG